MKPKINGYRQLTEEEAALINEGKNLAEMCGEYVKRLRGTGGLDQRWIFTGATDLQKGFMCLTRSIAQPITF